MSLPANNFSIQDLKTELSSTSNSFIAMIAESGESFDSLFDFSEWTAIADYITLSTDVLNFSSAGGSENVNVESSPDYAYSDNVDWLYYSKSGDTLTVNCVSNSGGIRTGIITITAGAATKQIDVTQMKSF